MPNHYANAPFKRYVLEQTTADTWTKRRDLCGRLIREGGNTPQATFEYRRQAIISMVQDGTLEQKYIGRAIYVRKTTNV